MNSVKICGLKHEAMIDVAIHAGASHVGFVHFEKSPRHLELSAIEILSSYVPKNVFTWIVLANPSISLLLEIAKRVPSVTGIQVHGYLTVEAIEQVRTIRPELKFMRAYSVADVGDLPNAKELAQYDFVLFDAKPKQDDKLPGGNGTRFNWEIMQGFESPVPWFLAGGLDANNVADALKQSGARMVDVSSGVESERGVKSETLIQAFIKAAKEC